VNVNDGTIPKYQKGEKLSAEQVEEERRLLYVGMTRAKKTLELHYLTGTKERPKFPSRFIEKLMK
jgi:superfamily I DNA/RNA helicase